jgi:hypothetical protein
MGGAGGKSLSARWGNERKKAGAHSPVQKLLPDKMLQITIHKSGRYHILSNVIFKNGQFRASLR